MTQATGLRFAFVRRGNRRIGSPRGDQEVVPMQTRTQKTTPPRAKDLQALGALEVRPMHSRLAVVGAAFLLAVWILARYTASPGPVESP